MTTQKDQDLARMVKQLLRAREGAIQSLEATEDLLGALGVMKRKSEIAGLNVTRIMELT